MTQEEWDYCAEKAKAIFAHGQKLAAERGLILVDAKYEFGRDIATGEILLIDEVHTPDSSRYWLAHNYEERFAAGKAPDNIDKEFVRLWYKDHCDPYKDETLPTAPTDLLAELLLQFSFRAHHRRAVSLSRGWRCRRLGQSRRRAVINKQEARK